MRITRFDDRALSQVPDTAPKVAPEVASRPVNICGVLIHTVPGHAAAVQEHLAATAGCEIHAAGDDGRLVVVIEDTAETTALDRLRSFDTWDGVAASALVFHAFEDAETLDQIQPECQA